MMYDELVKRLRSECGLPFSAIKDMREAADAIEELSKPKEKIEKKSKWIKDEPWSEGCGMGENYGYYYICSNCGKSVRSGYDRCYDRYCPQCGNYNA